MKATPPTVRVTAECSRRSPVTLLCQAFSSMLVAAGANSTADSAASLTTCALLSARHLLLSTTNWTGLGTRKGCRAPWACTFFETVQAWHPSLQPVS